MQLPCAATAVADALTQTGYNSIQSFTEAIARMSEVTRDAEIRLLGYLPAGE